MKTFSQFTGYFSANRRNVPASLAETIRREALARLQERFAAGYGATPLDFADLVDRMESAIAPSA